MDEQTTNGIPYTWELAGSNGAAFILYPKAGTPKKEIEAAKRELRYNRDVVSLRVANEDDWDEEFRNEVFRHPATRPLEWFEIDGDYEKIRKARKAGLTPAQYVEQIVLPNAEVLREVHLAQYAEPNKQYGK